MKYRPEIDGMRGLALIPVVLYHAGFKLFKGPYVMIDLFFVISGYLITGLIVKEKSLGTFSLLTFYERRARRLLPALYLVMLISVPLALLWLVPDHYVSFSKSLAAVPLFSSNFVFLSETGYFKPDNNLKPFLQTWSLAVEEQFYLLFPIVFSWIWSKGKRKAFCFLLLCSLASFGVMQWGFTLDKEANWLLLPGRVWEFLLGSLVALIPQYHFDSRRKYFLAQMISLMSFVVLFFSVFTFEKKIAFPHGYTVIPLISSALLIYFTDKKTWVGRVLCLKPFVGLGLISYGVYLWHQPLFAFARHFYLETVQTWVYIILIGISLLLSYLSWRFIEAPIRSFERLARSTFFKGAAICAGGFISFGFWGAMTGGLPNRFKIKKDSLFDKTPWPALGPIYDYEKKMPTDIFLQKWNQGSPQDGNLKRIPIVIYGNSFSNDVARALRANGRLPLHLGGPYFNEIPTEGLEFNQIIFEKLKDKIKTDSYYKYIVLASKHFESSQLNLENIERLVKFWKQFDKQLIVFSDTPSFPFLRERIIRGKEPKVDLLFAELSLKKEISDYLRSEGVIQINSLDLICGLPNKCSYKHENSNFLLYRDSHHLSSLGFTEFGRALISQYPIFR